MEDDTTQEKKYTLGSPENFREYLNLIFSGNALESQEKEFSLRIIKHFVEKVYAGETPETYALEVLAYALDNVVNYEEKWENALPLPWNEGDPIFTEIQHRDLKICEDYNKELANDPNQNKQFLKESLAKKYCRTIKTVEAALTAHKKIFKAS